MKERQFLNRVGAYYGIPDAPSLPIIKLINFINYITSIRGEITDEEFKKIHKYGNR